eukprot:31198-Pelagococcus_subviridis.AAC.52
MSKCDCDPVVMHSTWTKSTHHPDGPPLLLCESSINSTSPPANGTSIMNTSDASRWNNCLFASVTASSSASRVATSA